MEKIERLLSENPNYSLNVTEGGLDRCGRVRFVALVCDGDRVINVGVAPSYLGAVGALTYNPDESPDLHWGDFIGWREFEIEVVDDQGKLWYVFPDEEFEAHKSMMQQYTPIVDWPEWYSCRINFSEAKRLWGINLGVMVEELGNEK